MTMLSVVNGRSSLLSLQTFRHYKRNCIDNENGGKKDLKKKRKKKKR